MSRIDDILEKYFEGTSDLNEERELREYVLSDELDEKHSYLKPLFEYCDYQSKETAPVSLPKSSGVFRWIIYTGVAASLILAVILTDFPSDDNYVVRKGKRINDTELAQSIAFQKISKVNQLVARNLEPVQKLNEVTFRIRKYKRMLEKKIND